MNLDRPSNNICPECIRIDCNNSEHQPLDVSAWYQSVRDNTAQLQEENVTIPLEIRHISTYRSQLRQRLFDLYFKAAGHAPPLSVHEILECDASKIAMTSALDALSIAQLATTFDDTNLKAVARTMYNSAVDLVKHKIDGTSWFRLQQPGFNDTISALHVLSVCSFFTCIQSHIENWLHYFRLLLKLIQRFQSFPIGQSIGTLFSYEWEIRIFYVCLSQRKAVPIEPRVELRTLPIIHRYFLICCILQVPRLLERNDNLLRASGDACPGGSVLLEHLLAISKLVSNLKKWYFYWTAHVPSRSSIIGTKNFRGFDSLHRQQLNTFPMARMFHCPSSANDLRVSAVCLLELQEAVMAINTTYPGLNNDPAIRCIVSMAQSDAETYADTLCMLVPWAAQPQHGTFACTWSMIPLRLASRYYRKYEKAEKLAWCHEVLDSLCRRHGISADIEYDP